ncbi:MAG: YceD family protein [Luteimonas sp.]
MSADVPDVVDAWRMVAARRGFEGRLPLSSMLRLRDALDAAEGDARFTLEFDRDALQVAYVELKIDAQLPLLCQRSLQRFLQPVQIVQRLGLIREEADEAGLPEGYEPLLVDADGALRLAELVEDELILAVPLIPVSPGSESMQQEWPAPPEEEALANPFSALATLKKN